MLHVAPNSFLLERLVTVDAGFLEQDFSYNNNNKFQPLTFPATETTLTSFSPVDVVTAAGDSVAGLVRWLVSTTYGASMPDLSM